MSEEVKQTELEQKFTQLGLQLGYEAFQATALEGQLMEHKRKVRQLTREMKKVQADIYRAREAAKEVKNEG